MSKQLLDMCESWAVAIVPDGRTLDEHMEKDGGVFTVYSKEKQALKDARYSIDHDAAEAAIVFKIGWCAEPPPLEHGPHYLTKEDKAQETRI